MKNKSELAAKIASAVKCDFYVSRFSFDFIDDEYSKEASTEDIAAVVKRCLEQHELTQHLND